MQQLGEDQLAGRYRIAPQFHQPDNDKQSHDAKPQRQNGKV